MNIDRHIEDGCTYDLTIGSVFQDEAPYLKEWIEFHRMLGVQHFVLIDDRSSDNFMETLQPYIDAGEIELFNRPCPPQWREREWPQYQCALLSALVGDLRGKTRWLALIDIDEFIVPAATDNILEFLEDYESCGGIYIRWEPFGTSYVARLTAHELLTERLYMKWKFQKGYDMLGKSIVKPHRVRQPNIHKCELLPGYAYIDSNPGMENETSPIKLYHYWSRDEHFLLNKKLPRTSIIKGWDVSRSNLEYFLHLFNDIPDYSMMRFVPELRARVSDSQLKAMNKLNL